MWTGRTPWHIDGQNPLACRRRQLQGCWRRILACRQTPSFWHIDDHSVGISTETVFFGMSTENCFFACRREQSFLHVDGDNLVWHVDGDNLFCMSTETILFWHVDGDNPFGMSTVWHVDASYPGSPIFSFSRNSAANQWRVHPCAVAMPDMYNCNC